MSGLHQFANRLDAGLDEVLRPAAEVELAGVEVEARFGVERGKDFLELDRAIDGVLGVLVRRADDLAGLHAAAGEDGAVRLRPVIAAVLVVEPRRAAELAPDDDRARLCPGRARADR